MKYHVKQLNPDYDFEIEGASYIGTPLSNTAMFISRKVEHLLQNLNNVSECLIFAENGIVIPADLARKHCFICSDSPQRSYAEFINKFSEARFMENRMKKYTLTPEGYYIGENVHIGENAYIEPGCMLGHDIVIGNNARILSGTVIKNAIIGNDFLANEYAVIGSNGFTMAEDASGNKFRIPTLGKVIIHDHVEIGAHDNLSCGSGGDTVIGNYVKIDALVHIGHDVHIADNVEITAGGIIGGFASIGEKAYTGINACIRNRISLGDYCTIGMGATVTKSVLPGITVAGNPARLLERRT